MKMRTVKKALALLLAVSVVLCTVSGCGLNLIDDMIREAYGDKRPDAPVSDGTQQPDTPDTYKQERPETPEPKKEEPDKREDESPDREDTEKQERPDVTGDTQSPVEGKYFKQIDHWDVDYSQMAYEHYTLDYLDAMLDELDAVRENGADSDDFYDLMVDLVDELYYIYTLAVVAGINYSADPADETASNEDIYANDLFRKAYDEYWTAMHDLSVSKNAELLDDIFDTWQIEWFQDYEPSTEEELEEQSYEDKLSMQYYTLMSDTYPDEDALAELFVEMVNTRNAAAKAYGYSNYAEYAYDSTYARDYTPDDSRQLWENVKRYFVPIYEEYFDDVSAAASVLYASNLDCSPEAILDAMGRNLGTVSEELSYSFNYMLEHHLYDIDYSSRKSETGYTTYIYYFDVPYIFNCPGDVFYDYTDMFHEFGHFNNYFYNPSDLLYGLADNDLAELQSQGMEMLFTLFYDDIFTERYSDSVLGYSLLSMVGSIIDGAMYDEFLQRAYAEPDITVERLNEIYRDVSSEYGYSGSAADETDWMYVEHNFVYPFYYISYSVSAMSALEIYEMLQTDRDAGIDAYLRAAALDDEEYYFSEALKEIGLGNVFDAKVAERTAECVDREMGEAFSASAAA